MRVSVEQWQRMTEIFNAALELGVEEREVFLGSACAGDAALRMEVESLLSQHERSGNFILDPILSDPKLKLASLLEFNSGKNAGTGQEGETTSSAYTGLLLKDRYLIEKELGSGGVGVVYLARDQQLHSKPVVVKALQDESYRNPWFQKKFNQEIEALSLLDHPGIVTVSDTGQMPDGKPFYVMQYVEGHTLKSELKTEGMELKRAAQILQQMSQALGAAHEKGICHLDLKPGNVMVEESGAGEIRVRLIDFGVARIKNADLAGGGELSKLAGTLDYMAPEQIEGSAVAASDIYALGLIAYEILTGRRPFKGSSHSDLLRAQREGVSPMFRELQPNLPAAVEAVVQKALAFEVVNRYPDVRQFGEALAGAFSETERLPDSRARRTWLVAVAAMALAVASVASWRTLASWRAAKAYGSQPVLRLIAKKDFAFARVSPDGKRFAYLDPDSRHLWMDHMETGESRRLVEDGVDISYAWSRDSHWIAFTRLDMKEERNTQLEIVNVETGVRTVILERSSERLPAIQDWAPDGSRLLCERAKPGNRVELVYLGLDDKTITPIGDAVAQSHGASLSPTGKFVTYAARQNGNWDIYLARAERRDGPETRLTSDVSEEMAPIWSPDGRFVLYVRMSLGRGDLWAIPINLETGDPAGDTFLASRLTLTTLPTWSVSNDGDLFYQTSKELPSRIFFINLDENTGLPHERAETSLPEGTSDPFWSPDGMRFYYKGPQGSIERDIKTGEERILGFPTSFVVGFSAPSPDGLSQAFFGWPQSGQKGIYQYFPKTGKTVLLWKTDQGQNPPLSWSPDGRSLLWASNPKKGGLAVRVLNTSDGSAKDLALARSRPHPQWSPDGRDIAYTNGNCLNVISSDGGPIRQLTCAPNSEVFARGFYLNVGMLAWSPDGKKLAWTVHNQQQQRVDFWIVDYFSGDHVVWQGEANYSSTSPRLAWSPDGRKLAFERRYKREYETWRLSNFLPR